MRINEVVGVVVWAGLAYGLTKGVEDGAAWFGMRTSIVVHAVLLGVMVCVAAGLVYHLLEGTHR